jgi:hypothetical protein
VNLYERGATLRVALDSASEAAGDHNLVERGRQVITFLDTSTKTLEELASLRNALGFGALALETNALSQSARQLRTGITKYQAKAFQHASTVNFEDAVRNTVSIATRWAKERWRESFAPWASAIDRATTGLLPGDTRQRSQALATAQKLKALKAHDPLADRDKIVGLLNGVQSDGWSAEIRRLGGELTRLLQELENQHQALGPEVRQVLDRAATSEGFPLDELTPKLLERLSVAGVLGSLVVRRS